MNAKPVATLALLAVVVTAGPLVADEVVLANGETFEGVIAERDGDQVVIRLEFGELRLPERSVVRIDDSPSALSEVLERREALLRRGGSAAEWLELARFARAAELSHSYREALLEAAEIDPLFEGIGPGMRGLGYDFDAELGRWIPHDERMRRAGLVRHRGGWVRPEERAPERRDRDVEETLSRTVELLALAQLEREARESEESRRTTRVAPAVPYGYPVAFFGGYYSPHPADPPAAGRPKAPPAGAGYDDLIRRPPGSLLPVGGANSGTRVRPPGSLLPTFIGRKGTG